MKRVMVVLAAAALLLAAMPAGAVDICQRRARRCSTPPSPRAKAQSETMVALARRLQPGERIVVPVVYHVVYGAYGLSPGEEPDDLEHAPPLALTRRQTQTLNRAFRGTAFSFAHAGAARHDFVSWADPQRSGGPPSVAEMMAMIRELAPNRNEALHVFLMRRVENRAAPADSKSMFESQGEADAILMDWDYLPYVESLRPIADRTVRRYYYEGETLVHLVGHYLGLLDTFQEVEDGDCWESCSQTTDLVRDTPTHRWTWEDGERLRCVPLDTCPNLPGMDPITNYMNLEPDLCASEFSPGQIERMERMVRLFRPHFVVSAPGSPR